MEREEAAVGSMITVKKKKGKGKTTGRQTKLTTSTAGVSTNSFKVTQPSPFAEAIDPVVPEFNAQPKKVSGGRGRGKATKIKMEDSKEGIKSPEKSAAVKAVKDAFGLSDDETPPPSLFERLKGKGKQQSLLKFQKKVDSGPSDLDDDDDALMEVETPPRKTAAKKHKDANQKKPQVKAGKKRSQKTLEAFIDSDDDVPVPKRKKAVSKPAAKSAKVSITKLMGVHCTVMCNKLTLVQSLSINQQGLLCPVLCLKASTHKGGLMSVTWGWDSYGKMGYLLHSSVAFCYVSRLTSAVLN